MACLFIFFIVWVLFFYCHMFLIIDVLKQVEEEISKKGKLQDFNNEKRRTLKREEDKGSKAKNDKENGTICGSRN